jgi:ABC-type nickel/cobalt efflux system permease component RcnA
MRSVIPLIAPIAIIILGVVMFSDPLMAWASAQQRDLQYALAKALGAVRRGDETAIMLTIGMCTLYGVVHAVGPGHGKLLISGVALVSHQTAWRMAAIGLAASLTQGLTAIVLVFGGLGLFSIASRRLIQISEVWLTAASYGAIALVGLWLIWRGFRLCLQRQNANNPPRGHYRDGACAAGCTHMPAVDEVARMASWRDAIALIASIGLRPCSGAVIVLALCWHYKIYAVGMIAVLMMALGTGVVVASIALLAVRLRDVGPMRETTALGRVLGRALGRWSFATTMLIVGALITVTSLSLAKSALDQRGFSHPLAVQMDTPKNPSFAA